MYALLDKDEEVDAGVFPAYLRAQSDADLLDILTHLDPERYPAAWTPSGARPSAAASCLSPSTPRKSASSRLRPACLSSAGVIVLLTMLLTPADVAGPAWPTDEMLTNGTLVSTVMRLTLLGILRAVVGGAHVALGPLALLSLGGWLLARGRRAASARDVKRFVLLACLVLIAAFCWPPPRSAASPACSARRRA